MLDIISFLFVIFFISFELVSLFKETKDSNEFRKKELDYLDQILKKMR